MNISKYSRLVGSKFVELPDKLQDSKKGLININGNKCFLWCHIRHLNLMSKNPQRITKEDKKLVRSLSYEGNKSRVSRKDYCKIEKRNNICIIVFCYENGLTYLIYVSGEKFSDCMDLLLILMKTSHIMCILNILKSLC